MTQDPGPLLEIAGLTVSYGRVPALHGVDLHVRTGEIVGLVGPNGAGKTTTLSAIFGLLRLQAGDIRFQGESLIGRTPERIARSGIALVPEGRRIFNSLTVAENLSLGATGAPAAFAEAETERLLGRFPILRKYYADPAGRLSGGEQQQLAIARALLSDPQLLMLDEPSLGLSPLMVDRIFEILAELQQDGMTILLVEQNAMRTLALADRSYVLRSGAVALSGTREELAGRSDIAEEYLGALSVKS
jgi:branched-chain amino acid transport system ATP-binding protein